MAMVVLGLLVAQLEIPTRMAVMAAKAVQVATHWVPPAVALAGMVVPVLLAVPSVVTAVTEAMEI